jgi:flavin-dependent dehydrogenase
VTNSKYDAIVIGGGPAGSATAIQLARNGRSVLLLERQSFPRFHIGESMLPASNEAFRKLGLEESMSAERFVEKRGASFSTEGGEKSAYIDFSSARDVPAPVTYQVLRSRFDTIMLDQAKAAGAEVREQCRARDVAFEPGGVFVTIADSAGREGRVRAEVVVDASGQAGFLSKRLALRRGDPVLKNVALYAHFEGVPRPEGERSGDIRIVSRRDMGWVWLIPLSDNVTSVGVVMSKKAQDARSKEAPNKVLDDLLASTPITAEQMSSARRVSGARYEADFCYSPCTYVGDRWLLAGDAGSFLDPVFSSGVLFALESGLEAAEAIDRALGLGDVSAASFAAYNRIQRRRYKFFRRFVRGFYDPAFRDLFFTPTNRFGILNAILSVLAGNWQPSFHVRLKLEAFFALVFVQRIFPLTPRFHSSP